MIRLLRCRHNRIRSWLAKVLVFCILIVFVLIVYQHRWKSELENWNSRIMKEGEQQKGHLMCILIPFRNRLEELTEFVPRITQFLGHQNIKNKIVVINQVSNQNIYDFHKKHLN